MGKGSSWEFASNLKLDKKEPTTGISLQQLIMSIPSSNHPNYPLFHCVNRGWKEGSTVIFHFLPSNESKARMYISGLIAYLRATALPWYLDLFKPRARSRSQGITWDPETKQLTSLLDYNFNDTLQQDPLYDLTDSSAGLLSSSAAAASMIENSIIFDIPTDGGSFGLNKETDSISTFRSAAQGVLEKKGKSSTGTTQTSATTPTHSVSFAPFKYEPKLDNASVSKMSDTASKVAGLETHFEQMETQFSSSFARLEAMLKGLGPQSLAAGQASGKGRDITPVNKLANPPSPKEAGCSLSGAAGDGS